MIKYRYKGISLTIYCRENNVNYRSVLTRMANKQMTVEEAVDTLYKNRWVIKCEDGVPLIKKCKDLKEYRRIYYKMHKEASSEESKNNKYKYFHDGRPMLSYCKTAEEAHRVRQRLIRGIPMKLAIFGTRSDVWKFSRERNKNEIKGAL